MANKTYMENRIKYARPQGMLWSDNPGFLTEGIYAAPGDDLNSEAGIYDTSGFIIPTDDNRGEISTKINRIEQRKRMVNGTMRSYHIADKLGIDVSWRMIPSRAYNTTPEYNSDGILTNSAITNTTDGGAAGNELLNWYETHTGPFWVFLSYDKYQNFGKDYTAYTHLNQYNEIVEMYITNFDYSVQARGQMFDLWNVTVSLEEV